MASPTPEKKIHLGRKLVGTAVLWQDWDQEDEDATVGYWELFTDRTFLSLAMI
jgi:hypothetical protein